MTWLFLIFTLVASVLTWTCNAQKNVAPVDVPEGFVLVGGDMVVPKGKASAQVWKILRIVINCIL